jgi:hypothetical protein
MDAITEKLPDNAKPDPKVDRAARRRRQEERLCQLRRIQRCHRQHQPGARRLRSRDQEICRHRAAVLKAQIAQVQADKKMPAKDKKEALADLNEALKTPAPPIENRCACASAS